MIEDEATAKITARVLAFFEPEDRVNPWDDDVLETLVVLFHTLGISDEQVVRCVMFVVAQKIADDLGPEGRRQACELDRANRTGGEPDLHLV